MGRALFRSVGGQSISAAGGMVPAADRRRWSGRSCDPRRALVFVNDYTRDRVMAKYPAEWRNRTHVIPQGHAGPAPAMPRSAGPLRLVYTGRFYDGVRAPIVFLEAIAELHRASALNGRIAIEFVGSRMEAYAQQAGALGLESIVQFRPRVSPDQARTVAASADVLLIIDAPSDGPSLFLPSKLIDYLPLEQADPRHHAVEWTVGRLDPRAWLPGGRSARSRRHGRSRAAIAGRAPDPDR